MVLTHLKSISNEEKLNEQLAQLENGQYAICFPSGLACVTALSHLLSNGDHVLIEDNVYHGTRTVFEKCASRMGISATFIDMTSLNQIKTQIRPNTKLVWLETPTNPLLKLTDLKAVSDLVHSVNPNMLIVTDNTFCSPFFQKPLDFGVDIVLHSLTKYINGHSDVILGCVILNSETVYSQLKANQTNLGLVPSSFDCSLVLISLKTFKARMQQHMDNTLQIAEALEANINVSKVIYPPLKSHPQHELYKRQMTGFSGMIALYINGGADNACKFINSLKVFTYGESLGGIESLVKHPYFMNYRHVSAEERKRLGIDDNLFRLSIGLEDVDDLIEDLSQALDQSAR